jgi:hypothetical protein
MKNKKLHLQTLAMAVMLAASSMAAATAPAGPGPVTLTNTAGTIWTASIGNTPLLGAFMDVFTFTPSATSGSYAWTAVSNLSFTLDDKIIFTGGDLNGNLLTFGSLPVMGGTYSYAGLLQTPVSGPLTLTIYGTSTGGAYGGNFTVNMAPVPEPATYGMMIAGLGILAMFARRRKE